MSRPLLVRPEAENDLHAAFIWYEAKRNGLGDDSCCAQTWSWSGCSALPSSTVPSIVVRRALLRRFPFAVYYLVEAERIVVLAVLHVARDPRLWQSRG